MFPGKTTIILGAGASHEFGLPLGGDLTKAIKSMLAIKRDLPFKEVSAADQDFLDVLRRYSQNATPGVTYQRLLDACDEISAGMREAASIDEFIHTRRGDAAIEICGKFAIVRSILKAEHQSALRYDSSNIYNTIDFERISPTWIAKLRRFLFEGCTREETVDRLEQITFVNFNYDRCLEHYLYHSFRNYYRMGDQEAATKLQLLKVVRPYGSIGRLEYQDRSDFVKFGDADCYHRTPELATQIRTFTEQQQDQAVRDNIRGAIVDSEVLVFLGFAYHDQNLDVLSRDLESTAARLWGTAHGFSDADTRTIVGNLAQRFTNDVKQLVTIDNVVTCASFFDKYWKSLRIPLG